MSDSLTHLVKHPKLWRASYKSSVENDARIASGFTVLDSALNGGWPLAGLIRLRTLKGIGEVKLFLTLLQKIRKHQLIMFINAPGRVQSSWLIKHGIEAENVFSLCGKHDENLWAAEQCLKSDACQVVLLWSTQNLSLTQARRLQVCAKQHQSICILFEYQDVPRQSLPVELDLSIMREKAEVIINVDKQMGGWPHPGLRVAFSPNPNNNPILSAFEHYSQTFTAHTKVS
ncbi:recombinase RecA [Alteromonas sp. ASW11-130]|uniref:recombinase RecA n=1 Tax=Alteromonas sp. ASW11-130 TaxID=3015775 RepID=UPI002241C1ED|nr:recombinase RecA [Alteromonas sp. ASW11-130]MCW8091195.1 recombinase RecA [Alteromonas sp. ASW11-130]